MKIHLLLLSILWIFPRIQAGDNIPLWNDRNLSLQPWMQVPQNTTVSITIQSESIDKVDYATSLSCPRWWLAKLEPVEVPKNRSEESEARPKVELKELQVTSTNGSSSCELRTTITHIRQNSISVEVWSHKFLDLVVLVHDHDTLISPTKHGFSVTVCLAQNCWKSSLSTDKERWNFQNKKKKWRVRDERESSPLNILPSSLSSPEYEDFYLLRSSEIFKQEISLNLEDVASFLSDFTSMDILQLAKSDQYRTVHLTEPLTFDQMFKHLEQKESLVLRSFSSTNTSLARLQYQLEKKFRCKISNHLYIVPASLVALDIHQDSHDVIVFHAFGRKVWKLCSDEKHCQNVELGPGDCLYIPAGAFHSAQTSDKSEFSMAWSVGLLRPGHEKRSMLTLSGEVAPRGRCHACCYACCSVCGENWDTNSVYCSYHGTASQKVYLWDYGTCSDCGQNGPWVCVSCNAAWTGPTCASPICIRGEYFQDGTCIPCANGKYSQMDAAFLQDCISCSSGYYQDLAGQTECKQCPAGYYTASTGNPVCLCCVRWHQCPVTA
jgi:hypothetical protein